MSLINQGLWWYSCLANERDEWFTRLIAALAEGLMDPKPAATREPSPVASVSRR